MFGDKFCLYRSFSRRMEEVLVFNTLRNYPEGFTYYDLKQLGDIPHSRIYRLMKKMEEAGYLRKEEIKESGRPKHLYFLTERSEKRLKENIEELRKHFSVIREHVQKKKKWVDNKEWEEHLMSMTYDIWKSPLQKIMDSPLSPPEKLEILEGMKDDFNSLLKNIKKQIELLREQIDSSGEI